MILESELPMKQGDIMDVLVQIKRIGNALDEVFSVSKELAEAIDRDDQVSVNMLVSMRAEPIDKVRSADKALRAHIAEMESRDDADRVSKLLDGAAPGNSEEEMIFKLAAANKRQLEKVVALDKIINQKMTRDKSIYKKQ